MKTTAPLGVSKAQDLFSENLRAWRVKRNLLLKQVAADMDVSVPTLNAWETGHRFPTAEHLDWISRVTGIPVCLLFCGRNGECPYQKTR
jgi:transcriptional regulator with XRE-family HTH domain